MTAAPLEAGPAAAWQEGFAALAAADPTLVELARRQHAARRTRLNLVAAAGPTLSEVVAAQALGFGSVTAEGYPGRRYHPGAEQVDEVERLAVRRAEDLFGAQGANVQPLSGSAANLAVLSGLLKPGEPVLSLELSHGGHLSHVSGRANLSRWVESAHYHLTAAGEPDEDELLSLVREVRPRLLICGGSACPRKIDFAVFRRAADEAGALLMADISHISGLVAAGVHASPMPYCDVVSTSTYKQLCGPRGGLLLCGRRSPVTRAMLDRAVFPGLQGTPDFGAIAAKAVALRFAAGPVFAEAMHRATRYAGVLADALTASGVALVGGGTDTHLILADLRGAAATGAQVEDALRACGVLVNKNLVPDDPRQAGETSGIRLGTNELAFRALTDDQVAAFAAELAEVVARLRDGESPRECQAARRLKATAEGLAAEGFVAGFSG
ncbi:serine hydroxymethyltransferase [Amycolatopsis sp. NPDC059090]|uniref:serine hydroxymethyltransferase n=1 Tax=unclassified Amycolatopsis TaxID=2618356 RepID=UPI00366F177F